MLLVLNNHAPSLKLRYVYVDGIGAQRIVSEVNSIPGVHSLILYQRANVGYLVTVKAEISEVGEIGQRRDVAYLVTVKAEIYQAGDVSQKRDVAYLVIAKVESYQASEVGQS